MIAIKRIRHQNRSDFSLTISASSSTALNMLPKTCNMSSKYCEFPTDTATLGIRLTRRANLSIVDLIEYRLSVRGKIVSMNKLNFADIGLTILLFLNSL
ncbi:hypothetical protein EMIT0215P_60147 [Pseudomonas serboccidentalis]